MPPTESTQVDTDTPAPSGPQQPVTDPFARFRNAPPMSGEVLKDWDQIVAPGTPG